MTHDDLWATVCHPLPQRNYKSARRRAMTFRAFAILAALAIVTGGLVLVSAL